MKLKSQKGSITIFVLVALLFFTAFLLLMYAANTNKFKTISEKSDILKGIYEKNIGDDSIDNLYKKMTNVELEDGVVYRADRLVFDGTNYINTGIKLFSEENINKDFEISFDIIKLDQIDRTIIDTTNESESPYPGIRLYCSSVKDRLAVKMVSSDKKLQTQIGSMENKDENNPFKISIDRLDSDIIITNNSTSPWNILFFDMSNLKKTFDTPLTIGASLDENGNPYNFFNGELRNFEIRLSESTKDTAKETKTANTYRLDGKKIFYGKNYIDTGLELFSAENVNKDFEISFDIINIYNNSNQATLMNSMKEGSSPWQGFVYRINTTENKFELRKGSNGNTSLYIPYPTEGTTQNVKFTRRNKILYYSIDGEDPIQIVDFSNVATFNFPVTFGCSLNGSLNPQRYFKGTLANIKVELKD